MSEKAFMFRWLVWGRTEIGSLAQQSIALLPHAA
jgi:hypothetical protein